MSSEAKEEDCVGEGAVESTGGHSPCWLPGFRTRLSEGGAPPTRAACSEDPIRTSAHQIPEMLCVAMKMCLRNTLWRAGKQINQCKAEAFGISICVSTERQLTK